MTRYEVCPVSELQPGERKLVEVDGLSIGVFNVDGEFYALANVCPHQLAPLCEGRITGETVAPAVGEYETIREGEVIQCPWHGWKFNIADGTSAFNPHLSTRTFEVTVESAETADASESTPPEESAEPTCEYGTELLGDDPPVDTYEVGVESETVVLYV